MSNFEFKLIKYFTTISDITIVGVGGYILGWGIVELVKSLFR